MLVIAVAQIFRLTFFFDSYIFPGLPNLFRDRYDYIPHITVAWSWHDLNLALSPHLNNKNDDGYYRFRDHINPSEPGNGYYCENVDTLYPY